GVAAARGRTFLPSDSDADRAREVVLSDQLWRGPLAGANLVNQPVTLDGVAYTVIGIMPPGFAKSLFAPDAWTALTLTSAQLGAHTRASAATLNLAGRLRPGATLAEAQAELGEISARQIQQYPEERVGDCCGTTAVPIAEAVRQGNSAAALGMLLAITGVLLLIGCASVAGLFLERGTARAPEMATRLALGAPRSRLVRQLLTESLLVALLAAVAALAVAWLAMRWMNATMLAGAPSPAGLDGPVLAFTAAAALFTAILAGLAPALQASRPEPAGAPGRQRLRAVLVAGEIALALLGVAASVTLIQAVWQEYHLPLGYQPAGVLTAGMDLAGPAYATAAQRDVFALRLGAAAASLPGVMSVALVSPPGMNWDQPSVAVRGRQPKLDTPVKVWAVSPTYFDLLAVPRFTGRGFDATDDANSAPVAIISRTAAHRLFPGTASAIGQFLRIVRTGEPAGWRQVVGVVGDVRAWNGEAGEGEINVYEPIQQSAPGSLGIMVKSASPLASVAAPLRTVVRRLDPALPLYNIRTVSEIVDRQTGGDRYFAELLVALVALVLLAAATGLYGIVAFAAARRRREIAIRIALGAPRSNAIRLLLAGAMRLAAMGLAIGLLLAWLDSFVLAHLFEGTPTRSPWMFAAITSVLLAVVTAASYVPARRAARAALFAVLKEQ
ncbi:MAG: ABC transporter permease, partial [Terriglobales bacterium]